MDKKQIKQGVSSDRPVRELKWMAEFLASRGQQKKALEIYKALVDTLIPDQPEISEKGEPPSRMAA